MLMLTRKVGERIVINVGDVEIIVLYAGMKNGTARIGIQAPKHVTIYREELLKDKDGQS